MNKLIYSAGLVTLVAAAGWLLAADKVDPKLVATGKSAFVDTVSQKPGNARKITPADLPKPNETKSATNFPQVIPRPEGAMPQAPAGFKVELYATGLTEPRQIRTAPNGDLFFTEKRSGELKVA